MKRWRGSAAITCARVVAAVAAVVGPGAIVSGSVTLPEPLAGAIVAGLVAIAFGVLILRPTAVARGRERGRGCDRGVRLLGLGVLASGVSVTGAGVSGWFAPAALVGGMPV
ncbi:MAG: hypothetical protein JXA67_03215, partial [Micromonosporaceae bacterium]|nr:hypothetical protein [Micromonosporaceae bacterium]